MARTLRSGLLPLSPAFDFGCFVVNHVALCQFVSQYFCFPLSLSSYQCYALIFIYMLLLTDGQKGDD